MVQERSKMTDQRKLNDKVTEPDNVKKRNPEDVDMGRELGSSNTDLRHSKQKDERKRKDKATGPDGEGKGSSEKLDRMIELPSSDTGVGLIKAMDKTKRKDTGPDSVKKRSSATLNRRRNFLSSDTDPVQAHPPRKNAARLFKTENDFSDEAENQDHVQAHAPRKDTARQFKSETDFPDEAERQGDSKLLRIKLLFFAFFVRGTLRIVKYAVVFFRTIVYGMFKSHNFTSPRETSYDSLELGRDSYRPPVDWTTKARPYNPESDSSEEADIPDPDETQPKTGLPHPTQETRPPGK